MVTGSRPVGTLPRSRHTVAAAYAVVGRCIRRRAACSCFVHWMTDNDLRKATAEDVEQALAFALTHDGRKSYRLSNEAMARIVTAHLLRHLEISGFVLMKRPPVSNPTTPP